MKNNPPQVLYFFDHKECVKHTRTMDCLIEIVGQDSEGIRYRCRCIRSQFRPTESHDIYGYAMRKEAKAQEIRETRSRIFDDQEWLKKLLGEKE